MVEMIDIEKLIGQAEEGMSGYLGQARDTGAISAEQHKVAVGQAMPNLKAWMRSESLDRLSPNMKAGLADAIGASRWEDLVNAYRQPLRFGTGGIRGMMAFNRESILKLKEDGLDARILKGPGTINNIVLLRTSVGVAKFGKSGGRNFDRIVIGYDSRVRGGDFARLIAELFLAFDYTVYLFDEPCPYPMVTYAIPSELIKAQVGILISASHNDYRYNGYKLSCGNGSQFDPRERGEMYEEYIAPATFEDIQLCPLNDALAGRLIYLGGSEPVPGVEYFGCEDRILNIHEAHAGHVRRFLFKTDFRGMSEPLKIGFCAYHGAGRKAVPRMLNDIGLKDVKPITRNGLFDLDGMFPSFCSDPGEERQPDPGDPRAAAIAVGAFREEYPGEFEKTDILIGTDPDADRSGIVVKVPENQRHLYDGNNWMLLPADDMWALLIWFRLHREAEMNDGVVPDVDRKFVVYSHTSTDSVGKLCLSQGVGYIKSWVGFAALSACVRDVWDGTLNLEVREGKTSSGDELCHPYICQAYGMNDRRKFNIGALEQSNGYSLLGGPPPDQFSLGEGGHVRDKDGTFAAVLSAEVAAWAKENGTSLFELVDRHVYLGPDVGLFVNWYEPDPLDGEYPGIEGDRKKISILNKALDLWRRVVAGEPVSIGGKKVLSTVMYRTGKYDGIYPPSDDFVFPDEGIRFYFSDDKLNNLTVRPSGTGNSLRFHVQFHQVVDEEGLIPTKGALRESARTMTDHIRELLDAPR
jgi:phosphoglucomutase